MKVKYLIFFLTVSGFANAQCNLFCNGGFDSVSLATTVSLVSSPMLPCWRTTASDGYMEIWATGYNGVPSYSGIQHLEMNATMPATLYQNVTASAGTILTISFAHRGRGGVDSISVSAGPPGGPYTVLGIYGDGDAAWGYHTLSYAVTAAGPDHSIRFNCVHSGLGDPGVGNFLDAVTICKSPTIPGIVVGNSLSVFPNPFFSESVIKFDNPANESFQCSIFDCRGRLVRVISEITTGEFTLGKEGLSNGIYFISLRSETRLLSARFGVLD